MQSRSPAASASTIPQCQRVCSDLAFLGVELDAQANAAATGDGRVSVHAAGSAVEVWVLPTDEGRVAAESAVAYLGVVA